MKNIFVAKWLVLKRVYAAPLTAGSNCFGGCIIQRFSK
jgi:hypothetical protein